MVCGRIGSHVTTEVRPGTSQIVVIYERLSMNHMLPITLLPNLIIILGPYERRDICPED